MARPIVRIAFKLLVDDISEARLFAENNVRLYQFAFNKEELAKLPT